MKTLALTGFFIFSLLAPHLVYAESGFGDYFRNEAPDGLVAGRNDPLAMTDPDPALELQAIEPAAGEVNKELEEALDLPPVENKEDPSFEGDVPVQEESYISP